MVFPKQIQNVIDSLESLPGIGPKTAARLTFYLLHVPEPEIKKIGESIINLKKDIFLCSVCKNISDSKVCSICADSSRNQGSICVVEQALDVFSLEKAGTYGGLYHVLGGVIDPLHNIGPEELFIGELLGRLGNPPAGGGEIREIILALNPTMEGEATAMYLAKQLRITNNELRITRLGIGMPIGGDLQYADETTLTRAMEGRREY